MRDFENNLKHDLCLVPAVTNADADGASVDMQEYRYVAFYVVVGDSADTLSTTNKIELSIEDSADDSTFAAAADADVTNTLTGTATGTFAVIKAPAEDQTIFMAEYRGPERYVRVTVNFSGTHSTGTPMTIMALRSGLRNLPVSN